MCCVVVGSGGGAGGEEGGRRRGALLRCCCCCCRSCCILLPWELAVDVLVLKAGVCVTVMPAVGALALMRLLLMVVIDGLCARGIRCGQHDGQRLDSRGTCSPRS